MRRLVTGFAAAAIVALVAMPAAAQYSQNFDGLIGSSTGVVLTNQDGYYLPNGTGDTDFLCFTYSGNTHGFPQNPDGGSKFIAGTGPGNAVYARAQRDVEFGVGIGIWSIEYDFAARYDGVAPASDNIGSFSTRAAGNTSHIMLMTWMDVNNPVAMKVSYVHYDANNTQSPTPGDPPGPEWTNLQMNHWYHARMIVDLDQNLITEVAIRDLSGGPEAVYNPTGWYLYGGAAGGYTPDAIRFFGGGGAAGNTTAWDNMLLEELLAAQGACCFADGSCLVLAPADCEGQNGIYQGDDTTCDPNPCPPVPTETTTWGAIKNSFK